MAVRRVIVALSLTLLSLVVGAVPALAHAELRGSNPARGASLDTTPKQIQLTFSEAVSPQAIAVAGPQSTQWTVGQIAVEGAVVTAPVQAIGPAGQYTITYRVLSEDGDPVTGTVEFTLTTAAVPTTTTEEPTSAAATSNAQADAAAPAEDTGGVPGWVWIVVAIATLLAAGAVAATRLRGRDTQG